MAPTPQEHVNPEVGQLSGERVVISGIAGLYPESEHVKDFENILYDKKNPVTDENCRWTFTHPEVSNYTGKVPNLQRFDGQFFKVHFRLGHSMDSMSRKMLEQTYQAIYDAGVSAGELSGKKVGVYTGTCFSETEKACFYVASSRTGFGIAGCSKAMFANRISYWVNGKGPSLSVDDACCSSICALELAYQAISRGECEAAVVCGGSLCLHPQSTVHYGRVMSISPDGKTKSFDQNATGCAKSEAVNVLFLQKAKDAKRIYAEVVHVKTEFTGIKEDETGPKFGFDQGPDNMAGFLKKFYEEINVPPQAVKYVEAFGSATPEADKAELEALDRVFCKNRSDPLLVGSVMSNIGYGEAASGISAITKVLFGYRHGKMAGNLHCETPRQDVSAIKDGRMQILQDHKEFDRTLTAVNQLSVTGVNGHVLLNGHYKPKDLDRYKSTIPHLVTISGRQDTAVKKVLEDLKSRPVDPEELALFHNIHQSRVSGHMGRGYVILDTNREGKTVAVTEAVEYFDDALRPLWFVYSGMGSQWPTMGAELMKIPVFAAAIEKCRKVLEPKGIDIVHIITTPDKTIFDNILHSFVGIAAVQIGLTDLLTSVGIKPDKIIGHSVGELGCAYADGCFTAEEMILSAYSRGLVSVQTPFIKGSMAAVGLGYQQIKNQLPSEIEVACHNGPESCTISGPADIMKEYVTQLTAKGVFAKEVPCSNIAYHSRYIAEAGPGLHKYLSEVIKKPKARSERWVSSSVPEDKWNEPSAKYSSAEYHTNNLLNSVLFEETSKLIPANAVCIEIAPHGLLQAILKRSLPESCKHIPMTRRGHPDNSLLVLDSIGKLFMEGYNPKVQNLYPKVEFPVSTETPSLSHLVEWAHNEHWTLPLYQSACRKKAATCPFFISYHDPEYSYLKGNVIKGTNLYPFSAALVAAWDSFCYVHNMKPKCSNVEFRDIQFFGQPILQDRRSLKLRVSIHRANGRFEIMEEDRIVATGFMKADLHETQRIFELPFETDEGLNLTENDVYQILHNQDYFYRDEFRAIKKANTSLTEAEIEWTGRWETFLDGIFQLQVLRNPHESVTSLFQIKRICIDMKEQAKALQKTEENGQTTLKAQFMEIHNITRCGGVLVENVQLHNIPLQEQEQVSLKTMKFIPRFQKNLNAANSLQVFLQTVAENINKDTLNILGILNSKEEMPILNQLKHVLDDIPGITIKYAQVRRDKVLVMRDQFLSEVDLVLVQDLSSDDRLCQMLYRVLRRDTFLINGEVNIDDRIRPSTLFRAICSHSYNNKKLDLVKWRPTQVTAASTVVTVRNYSELELLKGTRSTLPQRHKLVILASYPPVAGLKDLVKQWRKENERNLIYLVMVSEKDNLDQLPELDLAYNVLVDSVWGGEYYTSWQENINIERGVTLRSSRIGELESLQWVEAPELTGKGIYVNVHYTAITYSDVKKALGLLPLKNDKEVTYCMDFSGVTDNGQRVMGILPSGAASGRVLVRPELVWPVPAHWSLEDAVTVPSAYAMAFYCYDMKVQFAAGYRVLVHGATGALGQAAIAIALAHKCEVFATVSNISKKKFLMKLFPQLPEDHIGNSRDPSFGDMVRSITKDKNCNIVFCNVKGELKNVSLNCLSACGIMLDVVQLQDQEPYSFGMFYLNKERNYTPVDFISMVASDDINSQKRIQLLVSEGIAQGYVRPLSRVTFGPHEVARAFRLLAASRHRGRVVISLQDKMLAVEPRLVCSPDLTQVVLCDGQTLGSQIVQKLVDRGAKKIVLHNAKPSTNFDLSVIFWEKEGVQIQISTEDLTNNKGIVSLLSDSNRLGPVEGIYVVATDASLNCVPKLTDIIANLDLASRKLCPSIRYFAIVNTGFTVGQLTCLARAQDQLPATMVNIPALRKLDDANPTDQGAVSWRGAVKAFELALRSSEVTVMAHPQRVIQPTLLQQIAKVIDVEIPEETNENVTLLDLGMDPTKVPVLVSFLKDNYYTALAGDRVDELTVQKVRELQKVIFGIEFPPVRGLATFFSYVDTDELVATTEMVFLPTMTCSDHTRDDEFDTKKTHLCIVPGLDGHHYRFKNLCERLKLPALVLQPGLDYTHESLRESAERYAKYLIKKARISENFYLLGYENGVQIALEIAAILEDHGLTGTVFCLGCTPEEFQKVLEQELSDLTTDGAIQNAVVKHMYSLMDKDTEGLDKLLEDITSWKEKIEVCVRSLLGRVAHSAQFTRNLMEVVYTRIKQARKYRLHPRKLKSKLVLLHAANLNTQDSPATLLQRYSQQPVVVHELSESLAYCRDDLRCAAFINSHLDSNIIRSFEEQNICETYLLNADSFMTALKEN